MVIIHNKRNSQVGQPHPKDSSKMVLPLRILLLIIYVNKDDDVIKWKHFPRYWSFVREVTGPREFPTQRPVTRSFDGFFDLRLK